MATITSAGTGNSNATATWVGGVVPDADDDVVIDSGHTVTQNANATFNSLALNGTFVASSSYSLTIDGENSSGQAFIANSGTFTHGNGTVTITTPAATNIYFKTENPLNNLIINHSSAVVNLAGNPDDLKCEGNLTITAGTLKSTNSGATLDVDGDAIVTGTLDWSGTSGGAVSLGSLRIDGTYSATSGTTIITSERSNGRAIDIVGTYTHNSGTLEIQTPADTDLRCPSSSSLNNLTINHASCIARPTGDNKPPIAGDLTITAGTFNTLDSDGSSNHALTVTGATTIGDGSSSADTATLTCNASTISLGSEVTGTHSLVIQAGGTFVGGSGTHTLGSLNIKNSTAAKCTLSSGNTTINGEGSANKAINIEGSSGTTNFAHGSGTVIITHDGASDIKADGVTLALNNLTINHASANINLKGNLSVAGNLVISAGELDTDSSNFALTVTGDASVTGTLTGNASAISLGSITIPSGGTYSATSGTTTITGDPGGYPNFGINIDGTFTHNSGTLKYTGGGGAFDLSGTGNLYNFEHAPTDTTFITNNTTIENNLTMTGANFQGANGNEDLTVKGIVTINSANKQLNSNGSSEHTFGFLQILDGTYKVQNDTGGFTKVGGIRNVGGTVTNSV